MRELPSPIQISVLIPVYNNELFIGRCLRSLFSQTINLEEVEIIVINDGSTDQTMEVIRQYGNKIRLIDLSQNIGLPAALNCGIRSAQGQYIVRVDSDDYVHKDFLSVLRLYLQLNNDSDAVCCDYWTVDERQNVIARESSILKPIACGIMFRHWQIIDVGLYDNTFLYNEDKEFRARFCAKYSIDHIKIPLYKYRQHSNNMTKDSKLVSRFDEQLLRKLGSNQITK